MKFDQIEETLNKKGRKDESSKTIRVDMHCHSSFSDGALSPALVAKELSDAGVKYAALVDHNTIEGLPAFRRALTKYGIGYVSGVEITTVHKHHVLHLLGYGFDSESSEIVELLDEKTASTTGRNPTPKIFRTSSEIIDIIHRAGGIAVMAHPFHTEPREHVLKTMVSELADLGLDGIEALYGPNTRDKEKTLLQIAAKGKLFVSAGTDFHKPNGNEVGKSISVAQWKTFRNALIRVAAKTVQVDETQSVKKPKRNKNKWFAFIRNILLPAVLSLALFVVALFVFILPYFEETLMDRKRESIRQLSQAAWGVLSQAEQEVASGQMSLEQAQSLAKRQISSMRYGVDNSGYFWLQDTSPRILMHPFRTDLNDQDVSDYTDPQGHRIFVEFADIVLKEGEGYVSYVWQWVDDEERLEQKESFVRLFEPWGWVIGTGLYVHDVQAEIAELRNYLANISVGIVVIVMLILLYLIRQGVKLETSRGEAQTLLMESTERYQALSEAATEGALYVYDGRLRYANTVMYELL
ncbi:MAG: PHP domain-containing protein, partial [Clostridia bacterium]|nr:PHP domain-containing protein [Clostridia bacterium]